MGFLENLFTSPREREGRKYSKRIMDEWGRLQSSDAGVNTLEDVMQKYGLRKRSMDDVSRAMNPARGNLATRLAMMRSGAARRMSGANAMPELTFGNIDNYGAQAFGELEGDIAEKGLDVERTDEMNVANMLRQILAGKDVFGMNRLKGKSDSLDSYLNSLSGASTFDDILALGGTAAKFIKGGG